MGASDEIGIIPQDFLKHRLVVFHVEPVACSCYIKLRNGSKFFKPKIDEAPSARMCKIQYNDAAINVPRVIRNARMHENGRPIGQVSEVRSKVELEIDYVCICIDMNDPL